LQLLRGIQGLDEKFQVSFLVNLIKLNNFDNNVLINCPINNEVLKEIFYELEDNSLRLKFLSIRSFSENLFSYLKDDEKELEKMLTTIDPKGQLLELYKTLNNDKLNKLKNLSIVSQDIELERIKHNFLIHLSDILSNIDTIIEMSENNPNLLYTMNYELLDVLDIKNATFFAKYAEVQKINVTNILYFKRVIPAIVDLLEKRINYPKEMIYNVLKLCSKFSSQEAADIFLESISIEELIYLANIDSPLFNNNNYINEKNARILRDYIKNRIKKCRDIINNPNATIEDVQNAYMIRFFGMSYTEAQKQVACFGAEIDEMLKIYESKKKTEQEKMEYYSLQHIKFLKEILSQNDVELLKELYEKFESDPEISTIDYLGNFMILEKLKAAYTKEKTQYLYRPSKSDKEKTITYNGRKIKVYKPQKDFNMLITVVGAYIKNAKIDENPYEEWNSKEKNVNQEICTSIIGNDNLSMAINQGGLKFGFFRLEENAIGSEACYDLSSYSNKISVITYRPPVFRTLKGIKDNIRFGHSEHLLKRNVITKNGEYQKRRPDYIVAINEITDKDMKAASEFGIPIVLLSTREIAKRESKKIQEIKEQLNKGITEDLLRELIVKYHNNYTGLFNLDKGSLKSYFNPKKMKKYIEELAYRKTEIQNPEERSSLAESFKTIIEEEEKKRKGVSKKYIPFDFDKAKRDLDSVIIRKDVANQNNSFNNYSISVPNMKRTKQNNRKVAESLIEK